MLSHFFKKTSHTSSENSDLEKGILSAGNVQKEHDELTSNHLQKLMTDKKFQSINERDKLSIRDGILVDLKLYDEIDSIDLAQALQIILLLNKDLHGLLNFTEEKEANPFKVQRSGVDEFFIAAADSIPKPTPITFLSIHYLLHHSHRDTDTSKFCLMCTCAVGVTCCTCWATAKSVEAVVNSKESNTFKGLKISASTFIGIGTTIASHYYFGDSLGEFLQAGETAWFGEVEYGLGSWGIPIILGLSSLWSSNFISAKLPCLPKTDVPIEHRTEQLIAYGENQKQKLEKSMGTEANQLLTELTNSILPYFTSFPETHTTNKKLQIQMALFAREVIVTWISKHDPKALKMLENKPLPPNRTYGTNTQPLFQTPTNFVEDDSYFSKKSFPKRSS